MRLFEYEGKRLLSAYGIAVPKSVVVSSISEAKKLHLHFPVVAKVQTLTGNRAPRGGVVTCTTQEECDAFCSDWLGKSFHGEHVARILIEECVPGDANELYAAIRWDTKTRSPVLMISATGGTGIEGRTASLQSYPLDVLRPEKSIRKQVQDARLADTLCFLWKVFYTNDATLVEVNPLFRLKDGTFTVADAKIEVEDTAEFRHPEWNEYPKRSLFSRPPTTMEEEAKKINAMDHRGVAGASFFEFDGDIAVMASGGGASLLAMDALLSYGLQPANYTEYSGNPSREKVAALTRLVLSKNGLKALWVIGGNANFTDIYETLSGVMDGIEKMPKHIGYPIVIRRGGPRWEEAFAMVKQRAKRGKYNMSLLGPETSILEAVQKLVGEYKKAYGNSR